MKKNTGIIIAAVTLIIGIGLGYIVGAQQNDITPSTSQTTSDGMHTMPDGQMMNNNVETMSMADMMASMNAELKGKTGDEFDRAFLTEMIMHHQGAVEMAKLALTNAKHQEIKDLANAIISAQNKEIADMTRWLKDWYNQ